MKSEFICLLKSGGLCVIFCTFILVGVAILLRTPFLSGWKAYLYRLLVLDIICCLILLVVSFFVCLKRESFLGFRFSSHVLCIGLATLFMALFFSLGPMVIERSYTVFSLAYMSDHAETVYTAEDIEIQFIDGYVEGANECQKRIDEQVYVGNLEQVDGGYRITEKGKRLIALFRLIEKIFPVPDENSIYPNGRK